MFDYGSLMSYGQKPLFSQANPSPLLPAIPGMQSIAATNSPSGPGFLDGMLGWTGTDKVQHQGWAAPAVAGASSLANLFIGMKQYGLAKDSLAEDKRQFGMNYDAQRTTTNSQLEDRQRARVASNPGAYQSVGAYMTQNGVR